MKTLHIQTPNMLQEPENAAELKISESNIFSHNAQDTTRARENLNGDASNETNGVQSYQNVCYLHRKGMRTRIDFKQLFTQAWVKKK